MLVPERLDRNEIGVPDRLLRNATVRPDLRSRKLRWPIVSDLRASRRWSDKSI
jgi:hypothetical protein